EDTHRRTVVRFTVVRRALRTATHSEQSSNLYYGTVLLTKALEYSAVPPSFPLLGFTNLPHVCLLHWLGGMRFYERHAGLLQVGGIAIASRLRRALQRFEVRRKIHAGRGDRPRAPSYH
ncbi:unnamed protein product, partial [Laminaria digitata]